MIDNLGIESNGPLVKGAVRADGDRRPSERAMISNFIARAQASDVRADPITLTHCYITLKSKPMAILVGPAGLGKVAIIDNYSQVFLGNNALGFQKMEGHAWWASGSANVAFFTEVQTRFNTSKILALIDEAMRSENRRKIFLACLAHISLAELQGYFASLAFQLQHGELIRLPDAHLNAPIPFPPNLLLVGTMDVDRFDWLDRRLLTYTSVIFWPQQASSSRINQQGTLAPSFDPSAFQLAWSRSPTRARFKLNRRFRWPSQAIQPVSELIIALNNLGVDFPEKVLEEVVIYLANCWSEEGSGLYALTPERNLHIALDMAVSHAVLPHCLRSIAQTGIEARLVGALFPRHFPRTMAVLNQWAQSSSDLPA